MNIQLHCSRGWLGKMHPLSSFLMFWGTHPHQFARRTTQRKWLMYCCLSCFLLSLSEHRKCKSSQQNRRELEGNICHRVSCWNMCSNMHSAMLTNNMILLLGNWGGEQIQKLVKGENLHSQPLKIARHFWLLVGKHLTFWYQIKREMFY